MTKEVNTTRIKLVTTYRTVIYCLLALSLLGNYLTYTGVISVANQQVQSVQSVQAPVTDDWITTMAKAEPVRLTKGKKR